jgi:hypothetical protein
VAGVGVKGNVCHHAEFRKVLFQRGNHTRHEPIRIIGFAGVQTLHRGIYHREYRHHRYPQLDALLGILEQPIQGFALHPRHGLHILDLVAAFQYKNRVNEIRWCEHMLTHQVSRKGIVTHAPHALVWVLP